MAITPASIADATAGLRGSQAADDDGVCVTCLIKIIGGGVTEGSAMPIEGASYTIRCDAIEVTLDDPLTVEREVGGVIELRYDLVVPRQRGLTLALVTLTSEDVASANGPALAVVTRRRVEVHGNGFRLRLAVEGDHSEGTFIEVTTEEPTPSQLEEHGDPEALRAEIALLADDAFDALLPLVVAPRLDITLD